MYSSRNDVPRKGSGLRSLVMRNEVQEIGIHPEYKDTAESRGRKNLNSGPFAKFTLKRIVNRYIATMFLLMVVYASYGNKLEKNENLILQNELYAVKICAEYRRSFLRSANAIVNFGEGTITIQPDFDPFLLSSDEEGNPNLDNLEELLDFDIVSTTKQDSDLPPLVCKMGKGSRNKKKILENIMYFNGAGPSSIHWNTLNPRGSRKEGTCPQYQYELGRDDIMKEERNITMINYTKAEVTGRLVNVLCQVRFTTLSAKFLILEIPIDRDAPIIVGRGFLDTIGGNIDIPNMIFTTFDGLTSQTFRESRSEKIRIAESDSDDEGRICD
ncbi:hypothetical protein Tco_1058467 [Tanacetum coccineum]|uniref:Uncharacterized protein n=1 Tax=Tanacetum coccineum TaxID=301880 RepID=A0ABQ5H8B9_9ASTR